MTNRLAGLQVSKKTMYEILEVMPGASLADIKAAHKRLSLKVMSGATIQNRQDCEFQLKVLDAALHTLSVPMLRDAYDAELAAAAVPGKAMIPYQLKEPSRESEARALSLVAGIEGNYKAVARSENQQVSSVLQVASSTIDASAQSLKVIIRAVVGISILAFVVMMGKGAAASRRADTPSAEMLKAEEKLIILEYYKKYGVRPASRAEAEFLEIENRRKENEQRAAEFAEKKRVDDYDRFVEESRTRGNQVHDNLVRQEMYEKQQQRWQEEEKRRQEEAVKEAERMRLEQEMNRYRAINRSGTRYSGE